MLEYILEKIQERKQLIEENINSTTYVNNGFDLQKHYSKYYFEDKRTRYKK